MSKHQPVNPKVKCVVNTCNHYVPGDLCAAGNIDILNEEAGKMSETVEQTMCKTFSHRSSIPNYLGSLDNKNWTGAVSELFLPGLQLTPTVTCVIDTCKYWKEGDICVAEAIEITGRDARECQTTNCRTFVNKGD